MNHPDDPKNVEPGQGKCCGKVPYFGMAWLKALWQGNRPLWEAFWIFGVGTTLAIKGVLLAFIRFSGAPAGAAITILGSQFPEQLHFVGVRRITFRQRLRAA